MKIVKLVSLVMLLFVFCLIFPLTKPGDPGAPTSATSSATPAPDSDAEVCAYQGKKAFDIATMRDQGFDWSVVAHKIGGDAGDAYDSESVISDAFGVDEKLTPDQFKAKVVSKCMAIFAFSPVPTD